MSLKMGCLKDVQETEVGTGRFKRDDIGIEVVNRLDDITELRIAHMGVNLCFRLDLAAD